MSKHFERHGNVVVESDIRVHPATIDYNDILAETKVVPDEDWRVPWEDCDGFEHTIRRADIEDTDHAGYCWHSGDRCRIVIELEEGDCWGVGKFAHANGASKQVAQELAAQNKRRTLEQLKTWYENGFEYWGVCCEFLGEEASLWGIDDLDYAEHEIRHEIALEVARQLEEKGFTVENKPTRNKRAGYVWRLKNNLLSQSICEPLKFNRQDLWVTA